MDKYIITKQEIANSEGLQRTHSLNANARRVNKSLGDMTGLAGFGFHIVEVEPGYFTTELHMHYHEDECVYILEGEAEATIDADVFNVKAGDFIGYRAGGKAHTLKNTGKQLLRCIVVGGRLDHDVVDYPDRNKRLFSNKGMPSNFVDLNNIDVPVSG